MLGMRNLVLLIVMLLAGGAGWYGGSWSGRSAKEALARAEEAGKQSQAAHEQAVSDLKAKLASQSADFERDKRKLNDDHAKQTSDFNALIASSKSRIDELSKARSGTQAEIQRLKASLATAATPQQRQSIEAEIVHQEGVEQKQDTQIVGQQCLAVPVPLEVLASWRGSAP